MSKHLLFMTSEIWIMTAIVSLLQWEKVQTRDSNSVSTSKGIMVTSFASSKKAVSLTVADVRWVMLAAEVISVICASVSCWRWWQASMLQNYSIDVMSAFELCGRCICRASQQVSVFRHCHWPMTKAPPNLSNALLSVYSWNTKDVTSAEGIGSSIQQLSIDCWRWMRFLSNYSDDVTKFRFSSGLRTQSSNFQNVRINVSSSEIVCLV